jgi:hypothetical protein
MELEKMDPGSGSAEDRRAFVRIPVEEPATLLLLQLGTTVQCTLLELSLEGCRVRLQRKLQTGSPGGRVEIALRLGGNTFRLSGVTQWNHGGESLGIQFAGLSPRREDDLADALSELAKKQEVEAARRGEERLRGEQALRDAKAAVDAIAEDLVARTAEEQAARQAAEAAADAARQAADQLGRARTALAAAEKAVAETMAKEEAMRVALEPVPMPKPAALEAAKVISGPSQAHGVTSHPAPAAAAGQDGRRPGASAAGASTQSSTQSKTQGPMPVPAPESKPQQKGRERRQVTRHAVDSTAGIFLVDVRSQVEGRILDVSVSGCRIRCTEKFPVGIYRRVEVEFVLDGLPFRLPGVVQSLHDRFTTGIRFLNLSERKSEQLLLLVQEMSEAREGANERPAPAA